MLSSTALLTSSWAWIRSACGAEPPSGTEPTAATGPSRCRISAAASAPICGIVYGPAGTSLLPVPRLSKVMTVYLSVSRGLIVSQVQMRPQPRDQQEGRTEPSTSSRRD